MYSVFLVLTLITTIKAQFGTCEQFAGNPNMCNGLFHSLIWVPPGYSQVNLSTTLINNGFLASALLPGQCSRLVVMISCFMAFRACGQDGLPLPLCPNNCEEANKVCEGKVYFNCSEQDPILQIFPLWEETTNRTGYEQKCQFSYRSPNIICPYPFIDNPYQDQCTMKCPPTGLDDKRVNDAIYTLVRVISPISIIIEIIIIPHLFYQSSGKAGYRYVVYWWICQLIASICDFFGKWNDLETFMCKDKWTLRTQSSTICGFGAIGPYLFRNASVTWIVIITYLILVRFDTWSKFKLFGHSGIFYQLNEDIVYHCLAWGPPLIGTIIAFSKSWINSGGPFGCYVITDAANGWAANILALIPLTIGTAMSSIFMIAITIYILKHSWKLALQQWRILFLSTVYTIVVLIVIIFSWITFTQNDDIKKAIVTYLSCIAFTGSQNLCPPLNNPIHSNFQIVTVAFSVSVPIIGGIAFINKGTLLFWKNILTRGRPEHIQISGSTMSNLSNSNRL